jgi:carboxymethylenebutenolidase
MSGGDVIISGDPPTPAYAALPAGAERGVVVIHEIMGRQPEIDRVVERFARAGYAAVAPDLFAGGFRPACIRRVLASCATGEGVPVRQALAAREWLRRGAGVAERRIGIIGFCLGGGFALAVGAGFGAVSTNYGFVPKDRVMRGIGPVIGCYGGRDRMFAREAPKLRAAAERLGVEHEVHVFPEVGHSFLTDGEHPVAQLLSRPLLQVRYDAAVAEDAWRRIFAFFDKHL